MPAKRRACALLALACSVGAASLHEYLNFTSRTDLCGAQRDDGVFLAWIETTGGVPNVFTGTVAPDGGGVDIRQLSAFADDDGTGLSGLTMTPDGAALFWLSGPVSSVNPSSEVDADAYAYRLWRWRRGDAAPATVHVFRPDGGVWSARGARRHPVATLQNSSLPVRIAKSRRNDFGRCLFLLRSAPLVG